MKGGSEKPRSERYFDKFVSFVEIFRGIYHQPCWDPATFVSFPANALDENSKKTFRSPR